MIGQAFQRNLAQKWCQYSPGRTQTWHALMTCGTDTSDVFDPTLFLSGTDTKETLQ